MTKTSPQMKPVRPRQPGERVRLFGVQRVPVTGAKCRVRVRLDLLSGGSFTGVGEGPTGLDDELRSAAAATVDALHQVIKARKLGLKLELGEVASFEAFGKPGVMVAIKADYANQVRSLLGFSPLEGDAPRCAAVAVLSATNRFLAVG